MPAKDVATTVLVCFISGAALEILTANASLVVLMMLIMSKPAVCSPEAVCPGNGLSCSCWRRCVAELLDAVAHRSACGTA
jgi:hypothetical protein